AAVLEGLRRDLAELRDLLEFGERPHADPRRRAKIHEVTAIRPSTPRVLDLAVPDEERSVRGVPEDVHEIAGPVRDPAIRATGHRSSPCRAAQDGVDERGAVVLARELGMTGSGHRLQRATAPLVALLSGAAESSVDERLHHP